MLLQDAEMRKFGMLETRMRFPLGFASGTAEAAVPHGFN